MPAPVRVQSKFTTSLSIPRTPPISTDGVSHRCIRASVGRSQTAQNRRSCTSSPSALSTSDPHSPAITQAALDRRSLRPVTVACTTLTSSAPPAAPAQPRTVTPPDTPGSTTRRPISVRGCWRADEPISVAHVSAAAAASEPDSHASARRSPTRAAVNAVSAATLPFARTCPASRRLPLVATSAVRPIRDKALDDTKNAPSTVAPRQPVPPITLVPTPTAAITPLRVSAPARYPARLIPTDAASPSAARRITTYAA